MPSISPAHRPARISLLLLAAVCWAAAWAWPPTAAAQQQSGELQARITQVDTSRYPEVTVYVSVLDAAGQPVSGLDADDFQLAEGGRPVDLIRFVGGGSSPVAAALVIDRSLSMQEAGKMKGARQAALAFMQQMRPGDRSALIAFNEDVELYQEFTGDVSLLEDAVRRLRPEGGTALYDSLVAGVDALRAESGRRALLLLTDGRDCRDDPSCPDEYGSRHTLDKAIDYAVAAGQPVYVIGLGRPGGRGQSGVDERVLRRIASETGGEYLHAPDAEDLAALYRGIAVTLQQEYAFTYRSPRPFYDGTRRDISVAVGGAPAARGDYLQQHLLHVRSNPVVGFILLVPLVWALLLPGWLRGRRRGAGDASPAAMPPAVPAALAADGATIVQAPDAPRRVFCAECGRPLREQARFCSGCGAPVSRTY